jgi:hypothetical protein
MLVGVGHPGEATPADEVVGVILAQGSTAGRVEQSPVWRGSHARPLPGAGLPHGSTPGRPGEPPGPPREGHPQG